MTYPENFENKIGFNDIRKDLRRRCISPKGRLFVDEMSFSFHFDTIKERLTNISEMKSIIENSARSGSNPFDDIPSHDYSRTVECLGVLESHLSPDELTRLKALLIFSSSVVSFFEKNSHELKSPEFQSSLYKIAGRFVTLGKVIKAIDSIIDTNSEVKDTASTELAKIRSSLKSVSNTVNATLKKIMSHAVESGILESDAKPSVRDGRVVIPVNPMNKRRINGIVHDESATGRTIFIEPAEIVEINNRIRELELEEKREIIRILTALTGDIRAFKQEIETNVEVAGYFDFIRAKARFAIDYDAQMPVLHNKPEIDWFHACHPVLKKNLEEHGKTIVPLDINLPKGERIIVISGPNAGGKSVCLKTVGAIQYMMQCGMLPTLYSNSHMGIFENILIDIGDDQSMEDDLSTYSSHLKKMKFFIQKGNKDTLILIDEFGSGTEPLIGGAIAQSILSKLNREGVWGVVTTHYQNLKQLAEDTQGLVNGSMLYDRHLMQPLFKLSIGNPGSSFAIEIAKKIGLPGEILDEAEKIVGTEYINIDKYLIDITRDKKYWESKRYDIRQKEKRIDDMLQKWEEETHTLKAQRKAIITEAKTEARQLIASSNAAIEKTIREIKNASAEKEATRVARAELEKFKNEMGDGLENIEIKAPVNLKKIKRKEHRKNLGNNLQDRIPVAGDHVLLDGKGLVGQIIEIDGYKARVIFGDFKTVVNLNRLMVAKPKEIKNNVRQRVMTKQTTDEIRERQLNFKTDIDVRGMRVDEALQAITYFIDDAIQFNAGRVRILHGTGTGALRQAIRNYLATVAGVARVADEDVRLGGAGITVVTLE